MPTLDDVTLANLAALARLDATAEDLARFRPDLEALLGYVERLAGVDDAIDPPQATLGADALRPDAPEPGIPAEGLQFAPARHEGLFVVPRTIDRG